MANLDRDEMIFVARGDKPECLSVACGKRHCLLAGATDTGKTVALQTMAEGSARGGVPVSAADTKGGLIVSRMRDPYDVQEGVTDIAFRFADDDPALTGLGANSFVDLTDLRELLGYLSKSAKEIASRNGNGGAAGIGAVQRQLRVLESQGDAKFFSGPAFDIRDQVEQVVRLIRPMGVDVYFVAGDSIDVSDKVLTQRNSRFQQALGAFAPCHQAAVKAAARTFHAGGGRR